MAVVRVNSKFDILDQLEQLNSPTVKRQIAEETIRLVKDFTSKGISSVLSQRRFESYKDPASYPARAKPRVPVNLFLSGDMLGALTFWMSSTGVTVGYRDQKQNAKALAHNEGTKNM